ncbi:MucR family transcriptional regulator [Geothermobacter hydrogeniphilus]|uniref:MucR family transcriptional regulator n=1 Tax=Geothermobacter hydrogeniphilus TaxID=1969733 RepID=A0A1X0Y654_9BACT|nr:MucR family transcriptional regulator [Geothermobacter hydrogeniphilus]ORJ60524.1 MucR family transcriptional regulator [Geothermobacter hydrogeniphilus]
MSELLQMAKDLVEAQATSRSMSTEEMVVSLSEIHKALQGLAAVGENAEADENAPAVTRKKAFGRDKVYCMICGEGMKTLARHLRTKHDMTPGDYRKQFDIPRSQPLAAKNYSEKRRQMAIDRGLADNLAKARAAKGRKTRKK